MQIAFSHKSALSSCAQNKPTNRPTMMLLFFISIINGLSFSNFSIVPNGGVDFIKCSWTIQKSAAKLAPIDIDPLPYGWVTAD